MRRVVLAAVSTIAGLIMLLSFKTHDVAVLTAPPAAISDASPATSTTSPSPTSPSSSSSSPAGSAAPTTTAPTTTIPKSSPANGTVTVTGVPGATRYGPVEVRITVTNGKVTDVEAVEYPTASARDRSINARAIPQLNAEVESAQSAKIDMVSGATYTSRGYISSLQSALDQAGLA
jgi:uncharacterized protein with FMN-binding domain